LDAEFVDNGVFDVVADELGVSAVCLVEGVTEIVRKTDAKPDTEADIVSDEVGCHK
jgi:hypothetical protein